MISYGRESKTLTYMELLIIIYVYKLDVCIIDKTVEGSEHKIYISKTLTGVSSYSEVKF